MYVQEWYSWVKIVHIQFIDHMKLKSEEDQNMDVSVLLRRGNKILTRGNTKYGGETEGKAIQRMLHPGIHPIYSHQIQPLLWMPRSAC